MNIAFSSDIMEKLVFKQVIQRAYKLDWIGEKRLWFLMAKDRNITSHVYEDFEADAVYERIKIYYPEMQRTYERVKMFCQEKGL